MFKKVIISGGVLTALGGLTYWYGTLSGNVHMMNISSEVVGAGLVALTIGITDYFI